jgi:predicted flap endonuclease-1-like 5' DNA nuclease
MFEQNVTLGPGTGTAASHTWEIIIMLLGAALLGYLLAWTLWNRYKQEAEKLRLDLGSANASLDALRTELTGAKTKLGTLEQESINLNAQMAGLNRNNGYQRDRIVELEADLDRIEARNRQLETELGLSMPAEPLAPADIPLEIVEDDAEYTPDFQDVETPADLAVDALSPLDLSDADDEAPVATTVADEKPPVLEMPEVASLQPVAVDDLPVILPLAPEKPLETPKPLAPVDDPMTVAAGNVRDDLTVIEGIGPKIQELLFQYGIRTYRQLATTDVTRIKEILRSAGPQLAMHDPGTWTAQALLAANDEWDNLKAYQGYLSAGKAPKK